MAIFAEVVIDSVYPAQLAGFWAGALDGYAVRAYDDEELDTLGMKGLTPETDPLVAVDGPGPTLFFQKTEHGKTARNRIHFDIAPVSRSEEVERLKKLGRDVHSEYTVMLDPDGNEFCIKEA